VRAEGQLPRIFAEIELLLVLDVVFVVNGRVHLVRLGVAGVLRVGRPLLRLLVRVLCLGQQVVDLRSRPLALFSAAAVSVFAVASPRTV
jgi:hypothetical protein